MFLLQVALANVLEDRRTDSISDVVFDSMGELFLVCKITGQMGLMDFSDFKEDQDRNKM